MAKAGMICCLNFLFHRITSCPLTEKANFKVTHTILLFSFCTVLEIFSQHVDFSLNGQIVFCPAFSFLAVLSFLFRVTAAISRFSGVNTEYSFILFAPFFFYIVTVVEIKSSSVLVFLFEHLFMSLATVLNQNVFMSLSQLRLMINTAFQAYA